jgi:hypothetical protein
MNTSKRIEVKFAPENKSNSWQQPIKVVAGETGAEASGRFSAAEATRDQSFTRVKFQRRSGINAALRPSRFTRQRFYTPNHKLNHFAR